MSKFEKYLIEAERDKDIWDNVDGKCPKCGLKRLKMSRDKKMYDCGNCHHAFQNKGQTI